jgi:hypothetical protein
MAVFWLVAPFSLVEVYRRFRGACSLHHKGDRHKTAIFILAAVRTWNLTILGRPDKKEIKEDIIEE